MLLRHLNWLFGFCAVVGTSPVRAETMLDWAKGRGAAPANEFEDEPALPEEVLRPRVTKSTRTLLIDLGYGWQFWRPGTQRLRSDELHVDGLFRTVADTFEPKVGSVGHSSRFVLGAGFGGTAGQSLGLLHGDLGTGALIALDHHGSGALARVAGGGTFISHGDRTVVLSGIGTPLGVVWSTRALRLELGVAPWLGWLAVTSDGVNRGTGPLYFETFARAQWRPAWLEVDQLVGGLGTHASSTRLSTCADLRPVFLCAEGLWLSLTDVVNDEQASFGRFGIRIGLGDTQHQTSSERPGLVRPR